MAGFCKTGSRMLNHQFIPGSDSGDSECPMKKTLVLALIIISSSFFLFGYWSGQNIDGFFNQLGNPSSAKARANSEELPNHQQNILLVQVDDLGTTKPNLESVWLMLYIKNTPKITWMPLYIANQNGEASATAKVIAGQFQLGKNKTLKGSFETALRKQDIWWNGYLITDKQGVGKLQKLFRESPKKNGAALVEAGNTMNPTSLLDTAVMEKVTVIQNICQTASILENPQVIKQWLEQSNNVVTDLPIEEITAQWSALFNGQTGLSCEFPSLLAIP